MENISEVFTGNRLQVYFKRTHGSIHKLLHLIEEKSPTLEKCIDSLLTELYGADSLCWENTFFTQLLFNIQALKLLQDDYGRFRSQIFKCEGICDSIYGRLEVKEEQDGL